MEERFLRKSANSCAVGGSRVVSKSGRGRTKRSGGVITEVAAARTYLCRSYAGFQLIEHGRDTNLGVRQRSCVSGPAMVSGSFEWDYL